jgi:hypothetical protein
VDFPVARQVLDRTEAFVHSFASLLPKAVRVPVKDSFRWEHPQKDAEATQVAKAVRGISGLRAAMHLADVGHTAECLTLLRTVADFSAEIFYLGEGLAEGRMTADQEKFVQQHFSPFPNDPDELAARERDYYIGRKDIGKAHRRLLKKHGAPVEEATKITDYLNKGYDAFVHGTNQSAMELYSGRTRSFMLHGHESARWVCMARMSVAAKLKEFLGALRIMAITRGNRALHDQIQQAWNELDASKEDTSLPCAGLS